MNRLTRSLLLGAIIGLAAPMILPAAEAEATSIAPLTIEQITDASTYIVRGTVTEVWTEMDENGLVWTRARVTIARVLKGPDSPTELIVDSLGGELGADFTRVESAARFSEHEDVLMFLDTVAHGTKLTPVGMFLGKFTIRRAPGDDRQYALQVPMDPQMTFDARFLPHPSPEERVYVDDLLGQVGTRLESGWDGQPIPGISNEKLGTINAPERRNR